MPSLLPLTARALAVALLLVVLRSPFARAEEAAWESFSGAGFSLDHPTGWQVDSDAVQGSITLHGPAGELGTFWPIFSRSDLTPAMAEDIARQLAARTTPELSWQSVPDFGNSAVKLVGRDATDRATVATLTWVNSPSGAAGCFASFTASAATFSSAEEIFAELLASLQLHGPTEERPDSTLEFERWRDPHEDAFEVEIPKDWQVRGGLARYSAVDTRPAVEVQSPGGRVMAYFGDARTPEYVVPSTALDQAGFPEGSWYSPGRGVLLQVKHYMTGGQFARWFASTTLASGRSELRIVTVRGRLDADRAFRAIYRRCKAPVVQQALNAGETLFTCRDADGPLVGYCFATTLETPSPRGFGSQWQVERNFGYLAAADRAEEAELVLTRLVASFRLNPEWVAKQPNLAAEVVPIMAQTGAASGRLIRERSSDDAASREEQLRQHAKVVLELADRIDPRTKEPVRIESGEDCYWIDPRGNVVGTDTYSAPQLNYRELVRLPTD